MVPSKLPEFVAPPGISIVSVAPLQPDLKEMVLPTALAPVLTVVTVVPSYTATELAANQYIGMDAEALASRILAPPTAVTGNVTVTAKHPAEAMDVPGAKLMLSAARATDVPAVGM
jgi:hypothetical protein